MKCLVAGAGGAIGGHLVRRLLDEGHEVRAVDIKPLSEWWQETPAAENFCRVDLRVLAMCRFACHNVDHVYNLACEMGGMGFIENNKALCMLSVLINTHLLKAADECNVKRYFYASSACVYAADKQDRPDMPALKESDAYPALAEDGYGWEKLFSERMCRHFTEDFGLETRVARFHNVYGPCFDDQTEVLTTEGWKFFANLSAADLIAARDSQGVMRYTAIKAFQQYEYSGPLHVVEHSATSQAVTPDHAIFATWPTTRGSNAPHTPPFSRHAVRDTKWDRARMAFTSACKWEGSGLPRVYRLPECRMTDGRRLHAETTVTMSDWFTFAGWYLSEGSSWVTPSNYTVSLVQSPSRKQREIIALLERMGYRPYVADKNMTVSNKQLYEAVQQFGNGAHHKRVPRWMLMANPALLGNLFQSLMAGDGDKHGRRYSTVSRQLADDVSEIALKLGKHAWVGRETREVEGTERAIFRVHIAIRPQLVTKRHQRTVCEYKGMVYDVTLADHHIMMVRRHGKPVWSGNCGTWRGGREKAPAAICRKVIEAKQSGNHLIDVWGDGTQTRSFMWIDDCIEGIRRLMDSDVTEPINIGSSELVTINQLIDIVQEIAGYGFWRKYDTTKPQGVRGRNSDNTMILDRLGWEPRTSLAEGLRITYEWIEEEVKRSDAILPENTVG